MTTKTITWSSDGYNGLIDWLGKNKWSPTTWAHPETTRGFVTSSAKNVIAAPDRAFDQAIDTTTGRYHSANGDLHWWEMDLGDSAHIVPTYFGIRAQNNGDGMMADLMVLASIDGGNWDELGVATVGTADSAWVTWDLSSNGTGYRYFKIAAYDDASFNYLIIGEVEIWGDYTDAAAPAYDAGAYDAAFTANTAGFGLFEWLGRDKDMSDWASPVGLGHVVLSANNGGTVLNAIDWNHLTALADAQRYHSTNDAGSYWRFDLGEGWEFLPTEMIMYSDSGIQPRNWKIQGSQDEAVWDDLKVYTAEGPGAEEWYTVDLTAVTTAYRYLQVINTGLDSIGNDYLVIPQAEWYGSYGAVSTGGDPTAVTNEYGDSLLKYLQDQGATSKEVVGALNELNATTGVEFDLAYRTYFAI